MALTHWKSSEDLLPDPWRESRELVPYWRRNWFWNDYLPYDVSRREFWDLEKQTYELERKLHTEFFELIPRYGIDGFKVKVDVSPFKPSELTVKTNHDTVEIEGKHEEYRFGRRYVSHQFNRRYKLPTGYNANTITSELSPSGILTITAPAPKTVEYYRNIKPSGFKAIKQVRF